MQLRADQNTGKTRFTYYVIFNIPRYIVTDSSEEKVRILQAQRMLVAAACIVGVVRQRFLSDATALAQLT